MEPGNLIQHKNLFSGLRTPRGFGFQTSLHTYLLSQRCLVDPSEGREGVRRTGGEAKEEGRNDWRRENEGQQRGLRKYDEGQF